MQIINSAKKRQEAEANKNASILLEELDYEKKKEEKRKAAAQKKRDKKKQKKKKKSSGKQASIDNNEQDDEYDKDEEEYEGFPFVGTDQRMPLVINGKSFGNFYWPFLFNILPVPAEFFFRRS